MHTFKILIFLSLMTTAISMASEPVQTGECGTFLSSSESEAVQKELASTLERITKNFGIQFKAHPEPPRSEHYYASSQMNEVICYLPDQYLKDPKASLENLKIFEQKIAMQKKLIALGLSPKPRSVSSNMSFELYSENPEPGSTIEWISRRVDRHGIKIFINDAVFVDDRKNFEAFALRDKVYLRSRFLKHMDTPEGKSVIAHEMLHAISYAKCGKYSDCGKEISFRSDAVNLLTGSPFKKADESSFESDVVAKAEPYAQYFSSDEMEAYRLSGDLLVDPMKKKEMYEKSDRFFYAQQYYLREALKVLEEGKVSFLADSSPSVTVYCNSLPVKVRLPWFDLRTTAEGIEIYKAMIKKRLQELHNHFNAIRSRARRGERLSEIN